MTRKILSSSVFVTLALLVLALPASSHLNDFTKAAGAAQPDRWPQSGPVVWSINPARGSNITGNRPVADVIQSAFDTWTSAPNARLNVSRGTDDSRTSFGMDGVNLVCFVCTGDFTSEPETLAVTMTTVATSAGGSDGRGGTVQFAGQMVDADILFNPTKDFTTDGSTAGQDLQTVATHEVGHFFGLAHSAIVRAVMYPFSPALETTLSYDDVAAISLNYGKAAPDVLTGTIAGTVRLGGAAVFGAHVFADSTTSAEPFAAFNIRKSPIGALTLPDGSYVISGVPADSYTVTAEPLDSPVSDSDVSGYVAVFGENALQTGFTTRWH
jgi:hypothetical protein